jgi:hypothetical protein
MSHRLGLRKGSRDKEKCIQNPNTEQWEKGTPEARRKGDGENSPRRQGTQIPHWRKSGLGALGCQDITAGEART